MQQINCDPLFRYLERSCLASFDCVEQEDIVSFLSHERSKELVFQFASDSLSCLYVRPKTENELAEDAGTKFLMQDVPECGDSITPFGVFIKRRSEPISMKSSISTQVKSIIISEEELKEISAADSSKSDVEFSGSSLNPVMLIRSFLKSTFTPWTTNLQKHGEEAQDVGDNSLNKRIGELDIALIHFEQSLEIPEVHLFYPERVTQAADLCRAANRVMSAVEVGWGESPSPELLNELTSLVNGWVREIRKVTFHQRDIKQGTAIQEVNYWSNMDTTLKRLAQETESMEIQLTLTVLKTKNRIKAASQFDGRSGLKQAREEVSNVMELMGSINLNSLLTATTFDQLRSIIPQLFNEIKKIKNIKSYPISRAVEFANLMNQDFTAQIRTILTSRKAMQLSFIEFDVLFKECEQVCKRWQDEVVQCWMILRDWIAKRNEKASVKFINTHEPLITRFQTVHSFRNNHDRLLTVLQKILLRREEDEEVIKRVSDSFTPFLSFDLCDLSSEGEDYWKSLVQEYDSIISDVEKAIVELIRRKLANARTGDAKFNLVTEFNALQFRPNIMIVVKQSQSDLLEIVKKDIELLEKKLGDNYPNSEAHRLVRFRDVPDMPGAVIWATQIARQLEKHMNRLKALFGDNWQNHPECERLMRICQPLQSKLDFSKHITRWTKNSTDMIASNPLAQPVFVVQSLAGVDNYIITVNVNHKYINLFKEVRTLMWLQQRPSSNIRVAVENARATYPKAIILLCAISTYHSLLNTVSMDVLPLVNNFQQEVRSLIASAMKENLHWNSKRMKDFPVQFWKAVNTLQGRALAVHACVNSNSVLLSELETCEYSKVAFTAIINKIQKNVDDIYILLCSNIPAYITSLDKQIETYLKKRLLTAIHSWKQCFGLMCPLSSAHSLTHSLTTSPTTVQVDVLGAGDGGKMVGVSLEQSDVLEEPVVKTMLMSLDTHLILKITNHILSVSPPVADLKQQWISSILSVVGIVAELPRIQREKDVFASRSVSESLYTTFVSILKTLHPSILSECITLIDQFIHIINLYVTSWLRNQSLWSVRTEQVVELLEGDLAKWRALLTDVEQSSAMVGSDVSEISIGAVSINYEQIQAGMAQRYGVLSKDLLNAFGVIIQDGVNRSIQQITVFQKRLEELSVTGSTSEAIELILFCKDLSMKLPTLKLNVGDLKLSENLLRELLFAFPQSWVYVSQLEGSWYDLEQIYAKRQESIQLRNAELIARVMEENSRVMSAVKLVMKKWEEKKPIDGHIHPHDALDLITAFKNNFVSNEELWKRVNRGKEALNLDIEAESPLSLVNTELEGLENAWNEVSNPWKILENLGSVEWVSLDVRAAKKDTENLEQMVEGLSGKVKQYECYIQLQSTLRRHTRDWKIIGELKNGAMKDRHWIRLITQLGITKSFKSLTLADLWNVDLRVNESSINEILSIAQGEQAIEEFIRSVKEFWNHFSLELVQYQNKCKLVRGWDILFTKLDEHSGALISMKQSPYYKPFAEEANLWHEKVTSMRVLFDSWIDIQRRWVYLEGIFFGSGDIMKQLPDEYSKFRSIDNDFVSLMRRVESQSNILDVVGINNLQRTLERLFNQLEKIQKVLGEYLEQQRHLFSRFYFVGDEDLLEIIGNGKDPIKVQKHLSKMFAGIHSLDVITNNNNNNNSTTTTTITNESNEPSTDKEMSGRNTLNKRTAAELRQSLAQSLTSSTLSSSSSSSSTPQSLPILVGMNSKEGESIKFCTPVDLNENSNVVHWLGKVEGTMRKSLALLLEDSLNSIANIDFVKESERFIQWAKQFPSQIVILTIQVIWSGRVDDNLKSGGKNELKRTVEYIDHLLSILAELVTHPTTVYERKKYEQLITEFVYQSNTTHSLIDENVTTVTDFRWQSHLRSYYSMKEADILNRLTIHVGDSVFIYGYEYYGVCERLVQTPLTDRCYLTLTQALHMGLGGNPFGPAGTGKTESVKMLAIQLGRFCLVFNCDESFDFQAMGRIFCGLCQVGAWGCFDEFNRLEERILSAVSQQIWSIQTSLNQHKSTVSLLEKQVSLHRNVGIFVTMNPGYAGRSNLPDNLKQLFRSIAMIQPDWSLIAQVMLFTQGFVSSNLLADRIVLLFSLCQDQLSSQSHYDFGLRALKSVLVTAGNVKRRRLKEFAQQNAANEKSNDAMSELNRNLVNSSGDSSLIINPLTHPIDFERDVLLSSVCDTLVPKLIAEDLLLLNSLLSGVFVGASVKQIEAHELRNTIKRVCDEMNLQPTSEFVEKTLQLYQVQDVRHGIMLVGPTGSGKSASIHCLLKSMNMIDGVNGHIYTIDPKAIPKDRLFGSLDNTTNEWTDGILTHIIRQVFNDVRGEGNRRHWIVFDGDVDPEWAENLNSVLDDNKLLTLPTGDRLGIPDSVRFLFEVQNLKYATPASVSRCGTVWYSETTVTAIDMFSNGLQEIKKEQLKGIESIMVQSIRPEMILSLQNQFINIIESHFVSGGLIEHCLTWSLTQSHIMEVHSPQLIHSFFMILQQSILDLLEYMDQSGTHSLNADLLTNYSLGSLIVSLLWGFGSSLELSKRGELSDLIRKSCTFTLPPPNTNIMDYFISVFDGQWHHWNECVQPVVIDPRNVLDSSIVIPTVDTMRNQFMVKACLNAKKPVILCGPPGSGKSMTLSDALQTMPGYDFVSVNFSSTTSPALIMKIFEQYCEYSKTPGGYVLRPMAGDKWLVIFCDEVNLPEEDNYGTQRVISFMRQLIEHHGFWHPKDHLWVTVDHIQFVAASNPPTDPGRVPLSARFLSQTSVVLVDYPQYDSLIQIYSTFISSLLRIRPAVSEMIDSVTQAMVNYYIANKRRFSVETHSHYVYSPRELSRWMRGLHTGFGSSLNTTPEELVRLLAHEALRLFCDRLVTEEERQWCHQTLDQVFITHFPQVNLHESLSRPILYTTWVNTGNRNEVLRGDYRSCSRDELREYLKMQLSAFNEEKLSVPLVLFDDVLEHVLRIDRVLSQPIGHLLLVGESGVGKTVLSRFVSWMNDIEVFQIKISRKYSLSNFDDDLRFVMKKAGVNGERICFIFDESNILSTGFLERMNALLASGEVPGLYEGDDMNALLVACRDMAAQAGYRHDSKEDLFKWFTRRVQRNLHVVFTMNPANVDFANRASTSPALFNRCVVDWYGTWNRDALLQVSQFFTGSLTLMPKQDETHTTYTPSHQARECIQFAWGMEGAMMKSNITLHDAVSAACLLIHQHETEEDNEKVKENSAEKTTVTRSFTSPRDYMDFIHHFREIQSQKWAELNEQHNHLLVGVYKLETTETDVQLLKDAVGKKEIELKSSIESANRKLEEITMNQMEAKQKRIQAQHLSEELERSGQILEEKQARVNAELQSIIPLMQEARDSVNLISKAHLSEIRMLGNPPINIRLTLQAVCFMLGEDANDWKDVQRVMKKDTFISQIVNFDTSQLTDLSTRNALMIMNTKGFDYESANRSSKACGPLFKWVKSQLEYSSILQRVRPLNDEMDFLAQESEKLQTQFIQVNELVHELDTKLEVYKVDYAQKTKNIDIIQQDIDTVSQKLNRSGSLLESLYVEKVRWKQALDEYEKLGRYLTGDCLLSAAFVTYSGFSDQTERTKKQYYWMKLLKTLCINYSESFNIIEFLCKSKDHLVWQNAGLSQDELCVQNAIILSNYNRYPLLIDPSGQATDFIMKMYESSHITKISFLDKGFMKAFENALRFGQTLLVQDVENADPVLNPVLNKEIHKEGGRTLVRVGDQEVDFSPSFRLFFTTRDSTYQFPPDLCSRITFVNFSVTPSSLQDQCLNIILKREAPDVFSRRAVHIQKQGECKARLRELEEQLLSNISSMSGNILDDNTVMDNLLKLKNESIQINERMQQSMDDMELLRQSSMIFLPLSLTCSNIFFILDSLKEVCFLYQFNLLFFLDLLEFVLNHEINDPSLLPAKRMAFKQDLLYTTVYSRVSRGLKHLDTRVFALRLCILFTKGTEDEPAPNDLQMLLRGTSDMEVSPIAQKVVRAVLGDMLSEDTELELVRMLSSDNSLNLKVNFTKRIQYWRDEFMTAPSLSFDSCLDIGEKDWSRGKTMWRWLLLIQILRPELLVDCVEYVVGQFMGQHMFQHEAFSLSDIVQTESKCKEPLLLCSMPGYDASRSVEQTCHDLHISLDSVAMGSAESFVEATELIEKASVRGGSVLLRNVHLCPSWLASLEKQIYAMKPNKNFRLFMTSEVHPKLPPTILRVSYKLMYENPTGIRASLLRSFNSITEEKMNSQPVERARIYFLLFWLHAVVEERLRYTPVGWTKAYEFSSSDLKCSLTVLDRWIDGLAKGLSHIDPDAFNWMAVRTLITKALYGGRVDNTFDDQLLSSLVDRVFVSQAFNTTYPLALNCNDDGSNEPLLLVPEGTSYRHFFDWTSSLPTYNSPLWLGLPITAEERLLESHGQYIVENTSRIMEGMIGVDVTGDSSVDKTMMMMNGGASNSGISGMSGTGSPSTPTTTPSTSMHMGSLSPRMGPTIPVEAAEYASDVLPRSRSRSPGPSQLSSIPGRSTQMGGTMNEQGGVMGEEDQNTVPPWMVSLGVTAEGWMNQLSSVPLMFATHTQELMSNPLYRFFSREVTTALTLKDVLMSDLSNVIKATKPNAQTTHPVRKLMKQLSEDKLPPTWTKYYVITQMQSCHYWFQDFLVRLVQLNDIMNTPIDAIGRKGVWLGGFLFPEAFITATRQLVAYKHGWSLDQVEMEVIPMLDSTFAEQNADSTMNETGLTMNDLTDKDFCVYGLSLEGAEWRSNKLIPSDLIRVPLKNVVFRWVHVEKKEGADLKNSKASGIVKIPLYLAHNRTQLLSVLKLRCLETVQDEFWTQRGTAIIAWKPNTSINGPEDGE